MGLSSLPGRPHQVGTPPTLLHPTTKALHEDVQWCCPQEDGERCVQTPGYPVVRQLGDSASSLRTVLGSCCNPGVQ